MGKTVGITLRDISNGERGQADQCPIAIATQRTLKTRRWIWVEPEDVGGGVAVCSWNKRAKRQEVIGRMPPVARRWLEAYDAGEPVGPARLPIRIVA